MASPEHTVHGCDDLLVLVHPGSLCGSFWFNGGTQQEFDALVAEVRLWSGPIVTIDNDLTNEIAGDRTVRAIYQRAVGNYEAGGGKRELVAAAKAIWSDYQSCCSRIVVTGLWVGECGCATAVATALRANASVPVEISSCAIAEDGAVTYSDGGVSVGNAREETVGVRRARRR